MLAKGTKRVSLNDPDIRMKLQIRSKIQGAVKKISAIKTIQENLAKMRKEKDEVVVANAWTQT